MNGLYEMICCQIKYEHEDSVPFGYASTYSFTSVRSFSSPDEVTQSTWTFMCYHII